MISCHLHYNELFGTEVTWFLYHVEWCSKQDVISWMCLMYFLSLSTSVYHKWTHPHFKIMQYHKNVRQCLLCLESNSRSIHVLEPGQRKSQWIQNLLLKWIIRELNFKSCCSWMHLFKYIPFTDKPLSEQRTTQYSYTVWHNNQICASFKT
jgi:hypothetical protein